MNTSVILCGANPSGVSRQVHSAWERKEASSHSGHPDVASVPVSWADCPGDPGEPGDELVVFLLPHIEAPPSPWSRIHASEQVTLPFLAGLPASLSISLRSNCRHWFHLCCPHALRPTHRRQMQSVWADNKLNVSRSMRKACNPEATC